MKVVILSCNIGGGHNSVAQALKDSFAEENHTCEIVDALSFLPAGWSEIISEVFNFGYRKVPVLLRKGYDHADLHRGEFARGSITRFLLDLGVDPLGKWMQKQGLDAVVCTHVFAGMIVSDALKKYSLSIPTGIVETDYTVTSGAEESDLDWHFVPCRAQMERAVSLGILKDRIVVSGIPVRKEFTHFVLKETAKRELGLHPEKKNILLCFGSMGCGPMEDLVAELNALRSGFFEVSVVCGNNKKLFTSLSRAYSAFDNIHVFSEMKDMSLLLDSADVYLTKPGGISTTEAAVKGVPMVLADVVGGIEKSNQEYFISWGGAVTKDSVQGLAKEAVSLAKDEGRQKFMRGQLRKAVEQNDSKIIVKKLTGKGQL